MSAPLLPLRASNQALCAAGGVGCLYIARTSVAPHRACGRSAASTATRTRRRVGRAAAVRPLGAALATRSRLGPVRTCPFPLAPSSAVQPLGFCAGHPFPLRAGPHMAIPTCPEQCVGMRVCVCVCVHVGVLRMTSTARAVGQRARPNAASTLSTHGGTPVPTVPPHTCGPSAGLLGCACCGYSEYSRRHTCPYRPPSHLWAKCGSAWLRARPRAHPCACVRRRAWVCALVRVRARVKCACACARVRVRVCAFMPESMRAHTAAEPPARNIPGCMLHRSRPVATTSGPVPPGTAVRVVVLFVAAPCRCAADDTAAVASPLWARGTPRVLHAARRLRI